MYKQSLYWWIIVIVFTISVSQQRQIEVQGSQLIFKGKSSSLTIYSLDINDNYFFLLIFWNI